MSEDRATAVSASPGAADASVPDLGRPSGGRWGRRALLVGGVGLAVAAAAGAVGNRLAGESVTAPASPDGSIPDSEPSGRHRLVFSDDFHDLGTIDTGDTARTGFRWYPRLPFGWGSTAPDEYSVADSVLRLDPHEARANYTLATMTPMGTGTSFRHGYMEARARFEPRSTGAEISWPAIWMLSAEHIAGRSEGLWHELDIMEAIHSDRSRVYATLHEWRDTPAKEHISSSPNWAAVDVTFSDWNTYGCLWEPRRVTWFVNRREVLSQSFGEEHLPSPKPGGAARPGTFSGLDREAAGMVLILGTGPGRPLEVDWVAAWQ